MVIFDTKAELLPDLMDGMNMLRQDKSLYDVCIKMGDHLITAHKAVLAPASDYFKSLFLGPFKADEYIVEVDFSAIALDVESVEAVIDFLYTGVISIDNDNLEAILKLATFLLIKQIQDLCVEYMKQCEDIDTYMWYFLLAVDYMSSDAEELVMKTVRSRFHDYFICQESTKALPLVYLKKLVEDYDIFENCTKIDTLSFMLDWALHGETDEHEELACNVIDSLKGEEPDNYGDDGSECHPQTEESKHENKETRIEDEQDDDDAPSRNKRKGFNITKAIETIKHKLENIACHTKLRLKFEEEIQNSIGSNVAQVKKQDIDAKGASTEDLSQDNTEIEVEQVLIVVAPKEQLSGLTQKSESLKREKTEVIHIFCVYKPRNMTWYYFEDFESTGTSRDIGRKKENWPINFCMHDKLCCVSPKEKELCRIPFPDNQHDRYISSRSYKYLVNEFPDFDSVKDVRFCCSDGETVYLVVKEKSYETEVKIKFNCYKLYKSQSTETYFDFSPPWKFLFTTPYIYNSEDPEVYESKSFVMSVSPDNKEMVIAVEGEKLHIVVANLETRPVEVQHHMMADDNRRLDYTDIWYRGSSKLMLLSNSGRLSLVDEIPVGSNDDPYMYYRNVAIDNQGEMRVDFTDHDYIDICRPSEFDFKAAPKMLESANDGKSIWLFSSNGKFETSMKEIRLNKDGFLDVHEHIPPPFASITLMATGLVKSEFLAKLKPITNFLLN